jgi:hypothetical protein
MDAEKIELAHRAHSLNIETARLSKRATDLAATSNELGVICLRAAKETSNLTRLGLYFFLVSLARHRVPKSVADSTLCCGPARYHAAVLHRGAKRI